MSFALTSPIRFARQDTERDQFELLFYLGYFDEMVQNRSESERERLWTGPMRVSMQSEIGLEAIASYQRFNGLTIDGIYGPQTKSALSKRFCSVPDVRFHPSEQRAAAGRPRWPMDRVTFHVSEKQGSAANYRAQYQAAMAHTIKVWNAVCGIQMETWEEGEPGPNIYGYFLRIDGNSSVLAWSNLAYAGMPPTSQLEQRYDLESWFFNDTGQNQQGINLGAVMCHEVGHALGMDHISANFAKALLNPYYDPAIVVPQKADIDVVRQYYGLPKEPPTPPTGDISLALKLGPDNYLGSVKKQ